MRINFSTITYKNDKNNLAFSIKLTIYTKYNIYISLTCSPCIFSQILVHSTPFRFHVTILEICKRNCPAHPGPKEAPYSE